MCFFGSEISQVPATMTDIKVIHISNIKPSHFNVSAPKRNQNGGLRVDCEYKDPAISGSVYLIQTPKLRVPFGLGQQEHENRASYSLSMSLDNYKNNSPVEIEFVRGIELIDEQVKKLACENSRTWFKKQMKMDVIDELYRPSIRYSEEWPPLFRCKLPFWSGKFSCDFYDQHRSKCESDTVKNGCNVISLVQLSSLWFMDKQFGCTWTVKQVQAFPAIRYDGFLIQENEKEDEKDAEMAILPDCE